MNYNSREIIITCGNLIITRGNDILLTGEKYWQYMAPEGFRNNLNQCRQKAHCGWRGQFSSKTLMKFTAVENDRKWHSYHCIRQSLYIYIYIYIYITLFNIAQYCIQHARTTEIEVWKMFGLKKAFVSSPSQASKGVSVDEMMKISLIKSSTYQQIDRIEIVTIWPMVFSNVLSWNEMSLHWCHNDHDGVSSHQPHGCLLNRLFRHRS